MTTGATVENTKTWHCIASDNLGNAGKQPYLVVSRGNTRFDFPDLDDSLCTAVYGEKLQLVYKDIYPTAEYQLRLRFLSDLDNRVQNIVVNGETLKERLCLKKGKPAYLTLDISQNLANLGSLKVDVCVSEGMTAVLSYCELFSTEKQTVSKARKGERSVIKLVDVPLPRLSPLPDAVAGVAQPILNLDGLWKFSPTPERNFEKRREQPVWDDITVPGEWVPQGFTVEANKAAGYYRTIPVPADWAGRAVKLRFDAVYSDAVVYVNGKKAGSHLGGFTPFELDVTQLIVAGEVNTLALRVTNESLADRLASGSQYACHPLGGIPRSVRLMAVPGVNLSSLTIRTHLDKAYKDAELETIIELSNEGAADVSGMELAISLKEWGTDKPVALATDTCVVPSIKAGETQTLSLKSLVNDPKKWTCETPNLYTLTCSLVDHGQVTQVVTERFGFRQIEVKGTTMLVNGNPIALRGVNRHEIYPLTGRSIPKHLYKRDIELFREANVNLVRTCHYPPDKMLMEQADELGMFLECEAPFCWAHVNKIGSESATIEATVRQNLEMVQFFRNHPSILFWSLGNESHWNCAFEQAGHRVVDLDPTRPAVFDTWSSGGDDICRVGTWHYPGLRDDFSKGDVPMHLGEYCHLNAYNRYELATDQGLRDVWGTYLSMMWEKMYADPGCAGGSIWAGIDDTVYLNVKQADGSVEEHTVGYGTWGPIDGWRRPKPEYWGMKKSYSPVKLDHASLRVNNTEIRVHVENRHDFLNLNRLAISWNVGEMSGTITADIPPRTNGELIINLPEPPASGAALELSIEDPRGFNIDSFHLPLADSADEPPFVGTETIYSVTSSVDCIVIEGAGETYSISRETGLMTLPGITGPTLMVLPVKSEGDVQMHGPTVNYEPYNPTCQEWVAGSVEFSEEGGLPKVVVTGTYKEAEGSFTYHFNKNGTFSVDYDFNLTGDVEPRQIGIVFEFAKSFENLSWKRKGFWSTYPQWHIGRLEGTSKASEGVETTPVGPRTEPAHEWRHDRIQVGSHDFASTKRNIYTASLTDEHGAGLMALANADRHIRAWNDGGMVRLLVAHFSNGGGERFLDGISKVDKKQMKAGEAISGSATFVQCRV